MKNDCVFCAIIAGEIPAKAVYEDDLMIVIPDIKPVARLHYLVIPKEHYSVLAEMKESSAADLGRIFKKIPGLAGRLGFENGYRLIINQGEDAGQSVGHLHIHLVGGQKMKFEV